MLEKHTDVFGEGLGMLKGTTANIYIVSDQPPSFFQTKVSSVRTEEEDRGRTGQVGADESD